MTNCQPDYQRIDNGTEREGPPELEHNRSIPKDTDFTQVSSFDDLLDILKANETKKCFIHFKVKKENPQEDTLYYHHFIFYNYEWSQNMFKGDIAQFKGLSNVSKFTIETQVKITRNRADVNFDFTNDLKYFIYKPCFFSPKPQLEKWKDEILYKLNDNGYAVEYILYEYRKRDFVTKIKEAGLRTSFIIALVASLAATFTRYSYVRLTMMTFLNIYTKYDLNKTCFVPYGQNIIIEAKQVLSEKNALPYFYDIPNADKILKKLLKGFGSSFVCDIAEDLSEETTFKTFLLGFSTGLCVEGIFLAFFIFSTSSIVHRVGYYYLWKGVLIRILSGPGSLVIGTCSGAFWAQRTWSPPAGFFILVCFFSTMLSRIVIFVGLSYLFDCLSKYCGLNCKRCETWMHRTECNDRKCTKILGFVAFIAILVLFCSLLGYFINQYIY